MNRILTYAVLLLSVPALSAQNVKTMDECMAYAAEHSSAVSQARWDLVSAKADSDEAMADFFPSVSAQVGGQFAWGRNIDPETNTYNDVSTFNNNYAVGASMTVFDGGRTLNRYRHARSERARSLNAIELQQDDKAISTMMAYVDAVYYLKAISLASDRLEHSRAILTLTLRSAELGMKSRPEVAQAQATVAADEYDLVHQRNMYGQAMLALRSVMNYPAGEPLAVDTASVNIGLPAMPAGEEDIEYVFSISRSGNPRAIDAAMNVRSANYALNIAKGAFAPTISLNAGISTSFHKTMGQNYAVPAFGDQFLNNRGEYVSATISIPIFSKLNRMSSLKRAKASLAKAGEQQEQSLRQLHDEIASAIMDRDGYATEILALKTKTDADFEAYFLNRRKYEEGLMSLTDMQLSSDTYFASRLSLLQKQMLYVLKSKLVDYYKGNPLYMKDQIVQQ